MGRARPLWLVILDEANKGKGTCLGSQVGKVSIGSVCSVAISTADHSSMLLHTLARRSLIHTFGTYIYRLGIPRSTYRCFIDCGFATSAA